MKDVNFEEMWNELKEYVHNAYNGENELEAVMQQIEENYTKKKDPIEILIKGVCK